MIEDPNIYDDGNFYQLLLKELVDQRRIESLKRPRWRRRKWKCFTVDSCQGGEDEEECGYEGQQRSKDALHSSRKAAEFHGAGR